MQLTDLEYEMGSNALGTPWCFLSFATKQIIRHVALHPNSIEYMKTNGEWTLKHEITTVFNEGMIYRIHPSTPKGLNPFGWPSEKTYRFRLSDIMLKPRPHAFVTIDYMDRIGGLTAPQSCVDAAKQLKAILDKGKPEKKENEMLTKAEYKDGLNDDMRPWIALAQSTKDVISKTTHTEYLDANATWQDKCELIAGQVRSFYPGGIYRIDPATPFVGSEFIVESPKGFAISFSKQTGQAELRFSSPDRDTVSVNIHTILNSIRKEVGSEVTQAIACWIDKNRTYLN